MGTQLTARIGLELHAQLDTRTKMFCGCRVKADAVPNLNTCPVCTGLPGAMPVPNREAVLLALRTGLALKATFNQHSRFDRKHYFYPDLPKGYQITQQQVPLFTGGAIPLLTGGTVSLNRIHLEEDAGRSRHSRKETLVDLNRCGVPLLEIVTEPVLQSGRQAHETVRSVRSLLRYLHVCPGYMQHAQLRCDANVSLTDPETGRAGTRVEIKNLNSLRHIRRAVDGEIARQRHLLKNDNPVPAETRFYDEQSDTTRPMRTKETVPDYRYMSEPDIPPLTLSDTFLREAQWGEELPHERVFRWIDTWKLTPDDAIQLAEDPEIAAFVEQAVQTARCVQPVCTWIRTEIAHLEQVNGKRVTQSLLSAEKLGHLAHLTMDGTLNERTAKDLIVQIWKTGDSPEQLIRSLPLRQLSDRRELADIVTAVLSDNPDVVKKYSQGNNRVVGFLMGEVMKRTNGRADPAVLRPLLEEKLNG